MVSKLLKIYEMTISSIEYEMIWEVTVFFSFKTLSGTLCVGVEDNHIKVSQVYT
jgi:hypothetical protein